MCPVRAMAQAGKTCAGTQLYRELYVHGLAKTHYTVGGHRAPVGLSAFASARSGIALKAVAGVLSFFFLGIFISI